MFGQVTQNKSQAGRIISRFRRTQAVAVRMPVLCCLTITDWLRVINHCSCFVQELLRMRELRRDLFAFILSLDVGCHHRRRDETSATLNSSRL
jgi:hypothetical protein